MSLRSQQKYFRTSTSLSFTWLNVPQRSKNKLCERSYKLLQLFKLHLLNIFHSACIEFLFLLPKKVSQSNIISLDIQDLQYHCQRKKWREESQHSGWIEPNSKELKLQSFIFLFAITTNFERIIFRNLRVVDEDLIW